MGAAMSRIRVVRPLSEAEQDELKAAYGKHPDPAVRRRAHAILLSHQGHSVARLQDLLLVDRDTVSLWIKHYEQAGLAGLLTQYRPGRPPIYTEAEIQHLKALIEDDPRRLRAAQAALEAATGKTTCLETLRRALKKDSTTPGTAAADP